MRNIVIFGTSGHSKVIVDIILSTNNFQLIGFIDNEKKKGSKLLGYQIIGDDASLVCLMKKYNFCSGIVGIGDNNKRYQLVKKIKSITKDFKFINCIHPSSIISSSVKIGKGNVIMPGVVVNSNSTIFDHCVLNTNSILEHDNVMKSYASLGPSSVVAGNCYIGQYASVGIGAIIFKNIKIEQNCTIGGGAVVTTSTKKNNIYYGVPAKLIK